MGQRERVTSLPFWKSAASSYSDKAACVSIHPSLAPPQQRGRTALKNNPCSEGVPSLGGTLLRDPAGNFRSKPGERDGRPSSQSPPGRRQASGWGCALAPCAEPTAQQRLRRRVTFEGGSGRFSFPSPEWSFPPFFSEPDGDAFGFSFNHVTFARRITRAGTALGRSNTRKPCFARGNHIKACVCVFGGRAQRGMMPGASCTRSCDL